MVLYKNDIFTQEDIKNYGFNLFNLPGHTTITRGLLIEFLQNNHFINNNIQIDDGTKEDDYSESFDSINTQMTIINNQIRKRVTEKEALLREYKAKQKEKEQLIEKEKQLDMQLKQLISEGTKFITEEDKGEKYDRKQYQIFTRFRYGSR